MFAGWAAINQSGYSSVQTHRLVWQYKLILLLNELKEKIFINLNLFNDDVPVNEVTCSYIYLLIKQTNELLVEIRDQDVNNNSIRTT